MMTSIERVDAVLAGRRPDRPPFSFWHHFAPDQVAGEAAVKAHLEHANRYGLDFLKVMNDNPYPHPARIERIEDLGALARLHGQEDGFGEQLALLAALKAGTRGSLYLVTTIFNAWAVLRQLIRPPVAHQPPNLDHAADDAPSQWIKQAYRRQPRVVLAALETIADNLGRFAAQCLRAGADGIFLSCRDDWLDESGDAGTGNLYATLVQPTDLAILRAAADGKFNILHVCGRPRRLEAFMQYPVPAINWADRAAGPGLAKAPRRAHGAQPVLCGGVDNLATLPNGQAADVAREVADAIRQVAEGGDSTKPARPLAGQFGDRGIIITPGCTYDPQRVPPENLHALAKAVRSATVSR